MKEKSTKDFKTNMSFLSTNELQDAAEWEY